LNLQAPPTVQGTVSITNSTAGNTVGSRLTLRATAKTGFIFDGWYEGNTRVSTSNPYIYTIKSGNITLAPRFKAAAPKTFKITWKLNKGTLKNRAKSYTQGKGLKLKKPTRKGFTFQGWFTDKKLKKRIKSITKKRTGKITLRAKWKKK